MQVKNNFDSLAYILNHPWNVRVINWGTEEFLKVCKAERFYDLSVEMRENPVVRDTGSELLGEWEIKGSYESTLGTSPPASLEVAGQTKNVKFSSHQKALLAVVQGQTPGSEDLD